MYKFIFCTPSPFVLSVGTKRRSRRIIQTIKFSFILFCLLDVSLSSNVLYVAHPSTSALRVYAQDERQGIVIAKEKFAHFEK